MNQFLKILGLFYLTILSINFASADLITVSSNISTDTTWTTGNTYYLNNTNLVVTNAILTIEPGVVIKYPAGGYLSTSTNGKIIAEGTSDNKIVFTSCKDNTIGSDASGQSLCTGSLIDKYYNRAIALLPESPAYDGFNYKFLEFRYALTAIWTYHDINSITDCNFSFGSFSGGTGLGFVEPTMQYTTKFERNTFSATSYNYSIITMSYNYKGTFQQNDIILNNSTTSTAAIFFNASSLTYSKEIDFSDNNFTLTNSRIYSSTGNFPVQDLNFSRNKITASNSLIANYLIQTSGLTTGRINDNNITITGNTLGAFYQIGGTGNVNIDFYRNQFDLSQGYNYAFFGNFSGNFNGDIYDNNITSKDQYAFYIGASTLYLTHSNIYRNNVTMLGSYRTANTSYTGFAFLTGFEGEIYDNNFYIGYSSTALRFSSSNAPNNLILRDNNFIINDNEYTASYPTYAVFFNTASTNAQVFNNNFDLNGKNHSAYYAYGLNFNGGDFNGDIHDNNFSLKNYAIGIYDSSPTNFSGTIVNNNFLIESGRAIQNVSTGGVFSSDINRNYFSSITIPEKALNTASVNYIINAGSGVVFSGNFCDNNIDNFVSPYLTFGSVSGTICNNSMTNATTYQTQVYYFLGDFTGKFTRNTVNNFVNLSTSGSKSFFRINGRFDGEISNNSFTDINYLGTSNYLFGFYGNTNTGKIIDNNFVRDYQDTAGTHYLLTTSTSGYFSGEIARNNFEGHPAKPLNQYIIYLSANFDGNIHDNNIYSFVGTGSNAIYGIRTALSFTGNIYNNNFYNNYGGYFVYMGGGIFSGNIYNNNLYDNGSPQTGTLIGSAYPFTGKIYGNKINNANNLRVFYNTGVSSGEIYNNLITNVTVASGVIFFGATSSANIINNTFYNIKASGTQAIYYGASVSSTIANNLFVDVLLAHNASTNFSGTAQNNAYYNVTTIGATSSMINNDQNINTGFTENPFVGDGTDRNFLLNTNEAGGVKLVNAGYNTPNTYFANKTTQINNSLDRGLMDIGYHYDQKGPYAYINYPNGGETVSGSQTIDFNVESSLTATQLDINLYYSQIQSGGTLIESPNLDSTDFTCTTGPIYNCTYTWDASDVPDGNYYVGIIAIDSNGTYSDYSDENFILISIPKLSLKTYLNNAPRSFFVNGEDANIKILTNSTMVTITITDPNGNIVINQADMNSTSDGYYYLFPIDGNYGWFDVKISGKNIEKAFYHSQEWIDKYNDYNLNVFPFSFDLNLQEPNINQRWFDLADINLGFEKIANPKSIRILEFNGTNYREIPSQVHDYATTNGLITSGKVMFLATLDKNENKQYIVSYSRIDSNNSYPEEMTLANNDTNYTIENSIFIANISKNIGGLLSQLASKFGTKSNLITKTTHTDIYASIDGDTTEASKYLNSSISILENTNFKKTLFIKGKTKGNGDSYLDYNILYVFYTKQPYFMADYNVTPKLANSEADLEYLYDSYFYTNENLFEKAFLSKNNLIEEANINSLETSTKLDSTNPDYYGVYKKSTGEGYAELNLSETSNKVMNQETIFKNSTTPYFYNNTFTGRINDSTYFNINNAKTVFNPWNNEEDLNTIYFNLENPLTYSTGTTLTGDNTNPTILEVNYTPIDLNDSTDLNLSVSATDNLLILSVDINAIQQEGSIFNQTIRFEDQSVSTYFIIPDMNTNAGDLNIELTVTDIAGNTDTNYLYLTLADVTAPDINSIHLSPDTNAGWDPGTAVTIDANIVEYTSLSNVNLLIRDYNNTSQTWNDWNTIPMNFDLMEATTTDYNSSIEYILPSDKNAILEYMINVVDSLGNDANSSTGTIYSYYDYTWTVSLNELSTQNGLLDSNIYLDPFTVTNTGDKNLTFTLTTNWDYPEKVYFNGTKESSGFSFTLTPDENVDINTIITTKSTERTDNIVLTINPSTDQAQPDSNTLTGTIISFSDGPFMYLEMISYPVSTTQGDSNNTFNLKVTNKGNQDASTVDLDWIIPSNWTITFGALHSIIPSLLVNESSTNIITITVSDSAATGNQTITVNATPNSDANRTKTKSVTTVVNAKQSSNGGNTGGGSGGGGSGGGGTTSSSPFTDTRQKDLFFQTNEFFELVRGQDNSFPIKFTNPLKYNMIKLNLSVEGLLSGYLHLADTNIPSLDSNQEFNTSIEITSPKYFNPGKYDLNFTINGYYIVAGKENKFTEQRQIQLLIHDTNRETAQEYIAKIEQFIIDLSTDNYKVDDLPTILADSNKLLAERDYDGIKAKFEQAQTTFNLAIDAAVQSQKISGLINMANTQGIDTPNTNRLLALAELAFQRGDYALALSRLKEAELTYSVETKGEINLLILALANMDRIILIIILAVIALFMFNLGYTMIKVDRQITQLNQENNLLLSLIADIQKKSFIENKISLGEYYDALTQFENRIAEVSEKFIQLTTRKNNLLTFSTQATKLKKERKSLLDLIKDSQKQYFNLGLIETRIYQTKINSLTKRLSEVDEQIVTNDLTKTLRTQQKGVKKYFWRIYYTIFK